jgi:hypothetical protein
MRASHISNAASSHAVASPGGCRDCHTAQVLRRVLPIAACVLALPATASAAVSHCAAFHGQRGLSDKDVKLAVHKSSGESELFGCVRPNGRVRLLDDEYDSGQDAFTLSVQATVGDFVVDEDSGQNQYGQSDNKDIIDVANGHEYLVYGWSSGGIGSTGYTDDEMPTIVLLDKAGACAVLQAGVGLEALVPTADDTSSKTKVLDPDIDAIPPTSVKLDGDVVHWTDAGAARSAVL